VHQVVAGEGRTAMTGVTSPALSNWPAKSSA
jgi:hypothetical protein